VLCLAESGWLIVIVCYDDRPDPRVVGGAGWLSTQHLLLSTDLLIADFALYFLAGWKFKIQDLTTITISEFESILKVFPHVPRALQNSIAVHRNRKSDVNVLRSKPQQRIPPSRGRLPLNT